METTSQTKVSRLTRVKRAFRKRWVWVCIVVLIWLLIGSLTIYRLGPKPAAKTAGSGNASKYKFLHCDQCNMELPYSEEMDGKRCPKCIPPKTGFYVPSELSVKSSLGSMSPWSKVYVATFVETVIMLGVVTFLLYRPVADPKTVFFVVSCPYCNQRLRYRAGSHGGLGSCSRCKRMLRFPEEEDAVTEDAVLRADEQAALADAERIEAESQSEEQ